MTRAVLTLLAATVLLGAGFALGRVSAAATPNPAAKPAATPLTDRAGLAAVTATRHAQLARSSRRVSRSGTRPALRRGRFAAVTAYCATGERTASGLWPAPGMVATLDRTVPFGAHVLIDGLGRYVVADRIGSGSDFDVFLPGPDCERKALRFGRKTLRVEVMP